MHRPSPDLSEPARNLEESVGPPSPTTPDPNVDLSMPPPDEDIDLKDGGRVHTPPPHIAARFYRPSQARRKDSAASSRRNSMSSAHSRQSAGNAFSRVVGGGDGPQSKYVAQHLRRASFLEDRKARLADRAAHAEKVRLRAALAKASTRDTSASEERALAAQQARERNLAEIVASCAEEVKRAKAVAESTREKREQELLKMRAQMEERLAEAERRREELLRRNHGGRGAGAGAAAAVGGGRSRGQSQGGASRKAVEVMPQVKEGSEQPAAMSEEAAAGRLQSWWRAASRKRAVREFSDLGLAVDGVRDTSFEKVVELLAQERVLLVTARVLRICGLREGDAGSVTEMAAVRTFLSAFLILGHPTQVLSNKDDGAGEQQEQVGAALFAQPMPRDDLANPQLQDLVGKARDLLITFENTLSRLTAANNYTPPPALRESLPEAYATFYNAFIAWKSRDSNALIEVMLMQFVELDAIWHTVKDSTEDAAMEQYRQSVKENQLMLIVRIKKLAGQEKGKKMIFDAVRQARKARAKKPAGDTRPRAAEAAQQAETSAAAQSLVSPESQIISPPATPSRDGGAAKPSAPPVGPSSGAWKLLPDNRIVVHELAINREYQILPTEYADLQHRNLFGAPVVQQLQAAAAFGHEHATFALFIVMAKSMSEKLQRLVKEGNSMHVLIREVFDPQIAEQQFALGSFSYERFFSAVAALLPKLCAPYRDAELKALMESKLQQGDDVIERAQALGRFVDFMVCDYINWMLSISAPGLVEAAPQYEAKRFAEEHSVDGPLPAAEAAWRAARSKVLAEAGRRDAEGLNNPRSRPTAERFYSQMLVDVFTQQPPPPPVTAAAADKIPEMLRLDRLRIARVAAAVMQVVATGAILLQCKNLLKRDARAPWRAEAARLMAVLEARTPGQPAEEALEGVMAALEAGRSMPAATKGHLRALSLKVLQATAPAPTTGSSSGSSTGATAGSEPREPVVRLLLQRLRGHMLARLSASASSSATEKVRATSTAGEKLAGLGLPEFVGRVQELVDEVAKVGAVDRAAHGPWWEAVAERVQQSAGASGLGSPSGSGSGSSSSSSSTAAGPSAA